MALSHPNIGIRSAACLCTRSLSRSVRTMRTALVDSNVAVPVLNLLSDKSSTVKVMALSTLCNLVLDFSAMKKLIIDQGIVQKLVTIFTESYRNNNDSGNDGIKETHKMVLNPSSNSLNGFPGLDVRNALYGGGIIREVDTVYADACLRLNAVWALKNMMYKADSEIKERVMMELGWDLLKTLLFDDEMLVQEQSVSLLRNLVSGKEKVFISDNFEFFLYFLKGEPEEQLNPKKKVFETVQPGFKTTDDLIATWNGHPFKTSKGVVKTKSLKGALIK
ncbi:Armadillo repeat-containing protein 8 [Nowakowskiella sp. JEL0078]|nr:Armadillo repeat-containing protein 8 [Nowakowskiella sp. JEL0078]